MDYLTAVLLGLAAAAGATLFPGMLNMTSVSVSLRAGRRAGYQFAAGMAVAFTLQAGLAIFFANYFTSHPGILVVMKQWSAFVFLVLAAFFLFKGYRAKVAEEAAESRPYRGSPFARGAVLALMNFLTIPYFFAIGGWLLTDGHLAGDAAARTGFTTGAGAGAMLIFGAYARLANWMHRRARFLTRNINFVLGALLVVLAVIQGMRSLL
ncbi:threonine/homoserine/homoserine lactone efflux protein [Lewinella aquimaris]|uniref:Threonine/homoserine/homoserine lactone efflux protein n=1 Tax=Neolewinella aquimaris TaxID=1835722 RepID=A0A840E5I0_9BACT|nr:LysE family transporter [Neolewinella aquimaris]MBB4079213.1 threonine/homoserine/homoserine lactone efflux protein [Neolewinella aquimaris]